MKKLPILILGLCIQSPSLFSETVVSPFEKFIKAPHPFDHSMTLERAVEQVDSGTEETREQALKFLMKVVLTESQPSDEDWTLAAMHIGELHEKQGRADKAAKAWLNLAEKSPFKDDADYAKAKAAEVLCDAGKGIYDHTMKHFSFLEHQEMFQESIRFSEELMYDESVNIRIRIFAQFIHLENHVFIGELEKADALIVDFLNEWEPIMDDFDDPDFEGESFKLENCPRRQIYTAKAWKQKVSYQLSEYQECLDLSEEILSERWTELDNYPNMNTQGYARIYTMMSLYQLGKLDESKEIAVIAHELEPGWFEAVAPVVARKRGFPIQEVAPFLSASGNGEF